MPADEIRHLAETLHHTECSAGTVLLREGCADDYFLIVLKGEVEVIKALGTADERQLAVRGKGSLLGEMSLVGPRPERPVYVNQFRRSIPRYMDRHWEKAGMTGWAAVNGLRGDTSIAERTKYDLWYIENWSLLLDIKIIVRTIFNVFKLPNAY